MVERLRNLCTDVHTYAWYTYKHAYKVAKQEVYKQVVNCNIELKLPMLIIFGKTVMSKLWPYCSRFLFMLPSFYHQKSLKVFNLYCIFKAYQQITNKTKKQLQTGFRAKNVNNQNFKIDDRLFRRIKNKKSIY